MATILTDLLTKLKTASDVPQLRLDHMNSLLRVLRSSKELLDLDPILECLRSCLCDSAKEIRANAFRILRHIVTDSSIALAMMSFQIDLFIVRALTRDQRNDLEREQAIKLVRALVETNGGGGVVPHSIVRVLVAIAEQPDDKFRIVAIETICELAVINIEVVALCGGLKSIFAALLDGPPEISEMLIITVSYILDQEKTRCYVRPSVDLEMLFANFTDAFSKGPSHQERFESSMKVICSLLKTWTGVLYLCYDDKRAIRAIVESLKLPNDETRRVAVESLFEIFRIQSPGNLYEYMTTKGRQDIITIAHQESTPVTLMAHITSILLIVFIDCGMVEALIDIMQDSNKELSLRCILLVGDLLQLTHRLLPYTHWPKVQPIASLFRNASNFADETRRHAATSALASIDRILRVRDRAASKKDRKMDVDLKERSRTPAPIARQRLEYDENQFKTLLADMEKMLGSKDFLRWNWDSIQELIDGPLANSRRMEEAIRNSKVVKRLVSFFRPSNHQFSDIKKGKGSTMFVQLGCDLFKTLLSSAEGVRYLSESKFLPEIAECLGQLDPIYSNSFEPIFSKSRTETTLTGEYFTILACFTALAEGIRLLEKFKVYNILYHLTELRSRDDLIKALVRALDFYSEGHERIILAKLMTSSYKHIRFFTTQHLGTLLLGCHDEFAEWALPMLITQLYDPAMEVCEAATSALEKAFDDNPRNLEITVNLNPYLEGLGDFIHPLLLRFLSTPSGFDFVAQGDFIDNELSKWSESENLNFVIRAEISLTHASYGANSSSPKSPTADAEPIPPQPFPLHFYGDLTRTLAGCQYLTTSGHLRAMTAGIKSALALVKAGKERPGTDGGGGEEWMDEDLVGVKAALWGLGFIGSNPHGLDLLSSEGLVEDIVTLALESTTFSIRGTCFHALGLLGKSAKGAELLHLLHWDVITLDPRSPLGNIAMPMTLDAFITVPKWDFKGSWPDAWREEDEEVKRFDAIGMEVLKLTGNMCNHILANAASKTLSRLRHDHPGYFTSIHLYLEVSRMLSCLHYRMTARRFLQELFDRVPFGDEETVRVVGMCYSRY